MQISASVQPIFVWLNGERTNEARCEKFQSYWKRILPFDVKGTITVMHIISECSSLSMLKPLPHLKVYAKHGHYNTFLAYMQGAVMRGSISGKDVWQGFSCKVTRCLNHQVLPCATRSCLTAVWTLKRGDNLISTHVNTTARAKRKLRAYCVSVISSCILWPQEWKIFKWLWCPGSCWTALMVGKHLLSLMLIFLDFLFVSSLHVNDWKMSLSVQETLSSGVCRFSCLWGYLCTTSNTATYASWKQHKCRVYTSTTLSLRALTAASICQSPCGYCCTTGRQTAWACGRTDPLSQQVIISN